MKIYVNGNYEVIALDTEPKEYKHVFTDDRTRTELFGNWCDTCIQGYLYEPCYEMLFNEDGSNIRDAQTGEPLYRLDEDGSKILSGYACYPYIDINTLKLIQKQYEDSQRQAQALNAQIEYMSMMSGIEMEANNE